MNSLVYVCGKEDLSCVLSANDYFMIQKVLERRSEVSDHSILSGLKMMGLVILIMLVFVLALRIFRSLF